MIRINLLPDDMRKGGRAKSSSNSSGGFAVGLLILLMLGGVSACGYLFLGVPYYNALKNMEKAKSDLSSLNKKVDAKRLEIGDLAEIEKLARNQLEVLTILDPPDRLLWSEKLNLLSDLRPVNVFIREITLTETVIEIETPESQKARAAWDKNKKKGNVKDKQPEKITRPQITQNLTILGISRALNAKANDADEQAIQSFLDFQTALLNHADSTTQENGQALTRRAFMSGLENLQIGDWKKEKVAGQWVIAFEFRIKTKPLFKQDEAPADENNKVASAK